jgi:hypothetical protein
MEHKMNSQDILRNAASTYNERGKQYGDIAFMFDTVAALATLMTGREYNKYDVTVIMEALKLARRRVDPSNPENYIDGVNYMTFSGQFACHENPNRIPTIEDDIAEFAKKFAPVVKEEGA